MQLTLRASRLQLLAAMLIKGVLLLLLASLSVAHADDIDILQDKICTGSEAHKYRFIFIVDNSGSMSNGEFIQSKNTIDAAITHVLGNLEEVEVAVVQYGTSNWRDHTYNVTVPFTTNVATATNWQRAYGWGGTVNWQYYQDHQPASLAEMRRDAVYSPGGALDITDGSNVQFVFFTDAWRDYAWGCCSSLVADTSWLIPNYVLPGFGEYDVLKRGDVLPGGLQAQFTVLSSNGWQANLNAAAAIASVGGSYTGGVESYASDPDGPGALPRRFVSGSLSATDTALILDLLDDVLKEIIMPPATVSDSFSQPSIDVELASFSSDNRAFFSMFEPSANRAWQGNVKGYFLDGDKFTSVDGGTAIEQSADGAILKDSARSFWSPSTDGAQTLEGGFKSRIPYGNRKLYSALGTYEQLSHPNNLISASNPALVPALLNVASNAQVSSAVNWLQGAAPGDSLHTKPQLVRYDSTEVLYAMTNQGLLHAIDASRPDHEGDFGGGEELWAYMPKELMGNLGLLSGTPTVGDHIYGLDGGITKWHEDHNGDGKVNGSDTMLLIVGQRRGGNNYYALDITDPTNPQLEWQIKGGEGDFQELGQTWSRMSLIRVESSASKLSPTAQAGTDRVLVFAGGYDLALEDVPGELAKTSGNGIYMVNRAGNLVWKSTSVMEYAMPADLSVVDLDDDGLSDRIYAADVAGQIWRIDMGNVADPTEFQEQLFADLSGTEYRPVFYQPDLSLVNDGNDTYLAVAIGTGDRSNPLDVDSADRMYMLKDFDVRKDIPSVSTGTIVLSDLYDVTDYELGSTDTTVVREATDALKNASGWMLTLRPGEKALSGITTVDGKILATTFMSEANGNVDDCTGSYSTKSSLYVIDTSSGSPTDDLQLTSETSRLTRLDRFKEIGNRGIPSAPVLVFQKDSSVIDVFVDKFSETELSTVLHQVYWFAD